MITKEKRGEKRKKHVSNVSNISISAKSDIWQITFESQAQGSINHSVENGGPQAK